MNNTRKLAVCGILTAILVVSKELLAFLPNIELVTFLLMLYALYLDIWSLMAISITFCFVQTALYGTGLWTLSYFMIWPLYALLSYLLRYRLKGHYVRMAVVSAIFGFCFGSLTALPYFVMSWSAGISYILRGLIFDLVHGIGNFILMIVLYDPLSPIMDRLFTYTMKS